MSTQRSQNNGGGLWNSTRPVISKETQNLLKTMMEESKLTNFQKRSISETMKNGTSLPNNLGPTTKIREKKSKPVKVESKIVDARTSTGSIRKLEDIVKSGAYEKSDYKPAYKKPVTDDDKERLVKIMAFGNDESKWPTKKPSIEYEEEIEEPEEIDRFDELQREVEERAEFLEQMTKLGKRKQYASIILTEISQKIREMELLDKQRTDELNNFKKLKEEAKYNIK